MTMTWGLGNKEGEDRIERALWRPVTPAPRIAIVSFFGAWLGGRASIVR